MNETLEAIANYKGTNAFMNDKKSRLAANPNWMPSPSQAKVVQQILKEEESKTPFMHAEEYKEQTLEEAMADPDSWYNMPFFKADV